jgi:hypothetical protein
MADNDTDRTEDTGNDEGAEALDSALDALVGLGEEADDETEATETSADGDTAPAADEAEDTPQPPTAESLGYDLKVPKDKAAYEAMVKEWGKWTNRFHAKLKTKPEQPAVEAPPTPTEAQGEAWDPYTVPEWKGDPEPEDSVLHGAETDIDRRINAAIKATLNAMRVNDGRLRELQQEQTVAEKLNAFGAAIKDHPDVEARKQDIIQFVQDTESVAKRNPDRWKKLFKAEFGFDEHWRDEDAPQRQPQRPAKSPLANVSRSTNGSRASAPLAGAKDLDFNEAADRNYRRVFGG